MRQKLLSVLVLYCFLVSSLMGTSSETPLTTQQRLDYMNNLVNNLTQQRDYYKTELQKQRKTLVNLEVYLTNQEKLSGNYRQLSKEEQSLMTSLTNSTVELELKLSEVSTQLTQAKQDLADLKETKSQQDKLFSDQAIELDKSKKQTTFWQWATGIASVIFFGIGTYLGLQI